MGPENIQHGVFCIGKERSVIATSYCYLFEGISDYLSALDKLYVKMTFFGLRKKEL